MTNSFCEVSLHAYGIFSHRHQPEIATHLGAAVIFNPHLGNFKRGILATITLKLQQGVTAEQVAQAFEKAYEGKPAVRLFGQQQVTLQQVQQTPYCDISWQQQGEYVVLTSAIDNLLKGASSQAMQCLNIHYGFDEMTALV
jgi:N-acetyl-gamma-glutamyl-phosphate reductase